MICLKFSRTVYIIRDLIFTLQDFNRISKKSIKGEIVEFTDRNGHSWEGLISYMGRCDKKDEYYHIEKIKLHIVIRESLGELINWL